MSITPAPIHYPTALVEKSLPSLSCSFLDLKYPCCCVTIT